MSTQGPGELVRAAAARSPHNESSQHSPGRMADGDAGKHAAANGIEESSDHEQAAVGGSNAGATENLKAMANGLDSHHGGKNGSKSAATAAGKSAAANGTERVEVELLDGSAKDAKILGEQPARRPIISPLRS